MLFFLGIFMLFCVVVTIYATVRTVQLRRKLLGALSGEHEAVGMLDYSLDSNSNGSALPLASIAALERELPDLDMVVVFAHTIEKPPEPLRDAVEANLARGVRYRFLISPSSRQSEATIFLSDLVTSAKYVKSKYKIKTPVDEMVSLESLTSEWDDVPYIFYRLKTSGDDPDVRSTIVFRGESRHSGLASVYHSVPASIAHTVKRFLLAQESEPINLAVQDFEHDKIEEIANPANPVLEFSARARS